MNVRLCENSCINRYALHYSIFTVVFLILRSTILKKTYNNFYFVFR